MKTLHFVSGLIIHILDVVEFKTTYRKLARIMPAMTLMAIYLTALWHKGPAHYFHHSQTNEAIHDDHCEMDACHLTIYHRDLTHGCDHKAHIIAVQEKCHICHEILLKQNLDEQLSHNSTDDLLRCDDHFIVTGIRSVSRFATSNRGPPSIG